MNPKRCAITSAPRERNYFGAALAATGCDRAATASLIWSVALAPILIASAARLLDTNAAGQTTFDRCSDEAGREGIVTGFKLAALWRSASQGDEENQLQRVSVPA